MLKERLLKVEAYNCAYNCIHSCPRCAAGNNLLSPYHIPLSKVFPLKSDTTKFYCISFLPVGAIRFLLVLTLGCCDCCLLTWETAGAGGRSSALLDGMEYLASASVQLKIKI